MRPPHPRAAVAAWLAWGLDRATVVPQEAVPAKVVAVRARLAYRDDVADHLGCVTLACPGEEGPAVSVLSPVEAALLGSSEGRSIRWRTASGGLRGVTAVLGLFQPSGLTTVVQA